MFDSWEGEIAFVEVEGNIVWAKGVQSGINNRDICGSNAGDPYFGM